jgi:isoleucyl-tRNA synthetase
MDYKNTLNLPRTEFSMKADLVTREPQRLAQWEKKGLYQQIQQSRKGRETFVLHDGPPFANGDVHVGTALNKILKDTLVRYQTLRGKNAPYIPGWDCHGLPIEFKVSQELRKSAQTPMDPVQLRNACEAYARRYIDLQRQQFKRLGVLGDWEKPYLTLDRKYEAEELRLFADLVEKGFVYRGRKPVYWSIPCRTALAEFEVEYKEHVSQSTYVKFPLVGHPNVFLLLWTTTPWTLPANLAVAYNSTFPYSLVHANGESYILSALLAPEVAGRCNWQGYQIINTLYADQLAELEYQHPFINKKGRLLPGDAFVDNTTGTGLVHVAPGHGLDDYNLGLEHGLPIYSPVNDEGRFAHTNDLPPEEQMPERLLGKSILETKGKSEANEAVLEVLRERNLLLHLEPYLHSYPHCWRSKTPVIFRGMNQWFIRLDHQEFRQRALDTIQQVNWVPDWGRNRMEAAVTSRPDWCISRQRTWGVPIPAFYDEQGNPILNAEIVRNTARLVEEHGSNLWFEKNAAELWAAVKPPNWNAPVPVAKSNDTLDVWIDSGSSSRAVLMQEEQLQNPNNPLPWQADMYLEGSDQHRGWFQSSLLLSLAANGAPPYRTVLTHGFMVDADREKISKSKQTQGGYDKPQTSEAYIRKYGADVVRLWVASQDFRNDIIVSEERLSKVSEMYRLLRNTLRYQLSNLYDFDPARHQIAEGDLTPLDRWMLDAFSRLEQQVRAAYDLHEFHVVYQKISQFAAVELSSVYHDLVKDRLYTDQAGSSRRRSTQTVLFRMIKGLCQMLSPILAFTADEAWELIPGHSNSVHLSEWAPAPFSPASEEQQTWELLFELREKVLPELEKARQSKLIGKALEAKVRLSGRSPHAETLRCHQDALREILNVSQLALGIEAANEASVPAIQVVVERAAGQKCERCWRFETEVGAHPDHPTLCPRCLEAIAG